MITALKQNYRDREVGWAAQVALSGMSVEKVVPALLEAFPGNADPYSYGVPLNQVKSFGARAVPLLVEGKTHPDPWAQWWARVMLDGIGLDVEARAVR